MNVKDYLYQVSVKSTNKIAVYSALTNSIDTIKSSKWISKNVDYFLFTDKPDKKSNIGWRVIKIPFLYRDPRRSAKLFKLFPNILFPDYQYSIWIDSNIVILNDLSGIINEYIVKNNKVIALCKHYKRSSVLSEAEECIKTGVESPEKINSQINYYLGQGFPDDLSLTAGGFIVRNHNSSICQELMNLWWEEIDTRSIRDQLSLNYVCWKLGVIPSIMPINQHRNNYFKIYPHNKFVVYNQDAKEKINLFVLKSKLKHHLTSSMFYEAIKRNILNNS